MPSLTDSDTIKILVSSDNHVGYNERDPIRGKDSWQTFHEVMQIAKDQDVDMVLLAGDLFHDNVPSRKSLYDVMRTLRMNCYGDKPCELEILSDASENFEGAFDHVNYEDEDINVAIPVFSIHGNHDDPSGEGHKSALDILSISGLINYYGKTPESDKIEVKPVLLQKGRTKLALYGLSNVRDERMHRTFREKNVKFFQPSVQKENWFNLLSVHQNRYKHTGTDYLPQHFLPEFMDLVVWGHEHECLIDPQKDHQMGFHVMQPGSTVATSLIAGEAAPKHVAVLKVTGKAFESESIPLKTVRPFVTRDLVLQDEASMKKIAKRENNRTDVTKYLESVVNEMIQEAEDTWIATQGTGNGTIGTQQTPPRPLVRLRVEYTAPEGGKFDCENPQRFSRRFDAKVANVNDVVQFHRKKTTLRKAKDGTDVPEEEILARLTIDSVKVEKLVREYLTAQSLTILPQNSFSDAVSQFIDKDDIYAIEAFMEGSLSDQVKHLMGTDEADNEDIQQALDKHRARLEELFAGGKSRKYLNRKLKPKPANWDDELGDWAEQPGALMLSDNEGEGDNGDETGENAGRAMISSASGRGRGRGRAAKSNGTTRSATSRKVTPSSGRRTARGSKNKVTRNGASDEDGDDDVVMLDDDLKQALHSQKGTSAAEASRTGQRNISTRKAPARAAAPRQTTLAFSQSTPRATSTGVRGPFTQELSDDEISDDDDDAFEPGPSSARLKH